MVSIFRKNDVVNFFLLLPYTILLRVYSIIHPASYTFSENETIVTKWIFSLISAPLAQSIVAIFLVFIQASLINILANNHRMHRLPTALAGMLYILFVSCIKEFQVLSPALIGMTFILIAIFNVFKTYKLANAAPNIFNAAFACGVATAIYPPYLISLLALFIGFALIRNFSAKERVQFLIGFGILFWIIGTFLFFFDLLNWSAFNNFEVPGAITDLWTTDGNLWFSLSIAALFVLISLINYYNYMKKKVIDIRKKIDFFYWLLLCSFLSLLFFNSLDFQHFLFLAASLSIFISMSILLIKNEALAELLHVIVLVVAFYFQFIGI